MIFIYQKNDQKNRNFTENICGEIIFFLENVFIGIYKN